MTTPCRIYPVRDCEGREANMFTNCKKCPGPVDLSNGGPDEKRSAPAPAVEPDDDHEEVVEVAKEAKAKPGPKAATGVVCDRCKREAHLGTVQSQTGRYCGSCAVTINKARRQGKPVPAFAGVRGPRSGGPTKPTAAPSAKKPASAPKAVPGITEPKGKAPAKIVHPKPAEVVADVGMRLVFELVLPAGSTSLELMDLLRQVPVNARLVG